jgi:hypothetical protein
MAHVGFIILIVFLSALASRQRHPLEPLAMRGAQFIGTFCVLYYTFWYAYSDLHWWQIVLILLAWQAVDFVMIMIMTRNLRF